MAKSLRSLSSYLRIRIRVKKIGGLKREGLRDKGRDVVNGRGVFKWNWEVAKSLRTEPFLASLVKSRIRRAGRVGGME